MLSIDAGDSGGIEIGVPAFSVFHLGENVLMYANRSASVCGTTGRHCGMFEFTSPRRIEAMRSRSVGNVPLGVERHLKTAAVKSRGLGSIHWAFSPNPSPCPPWQPIQYRSYSC